MTPPLKPVRPPVIGPLRTDKDVTTAIEELQRQVRELTTLVNAMLSRQQSGTGA